MTPPDSGEMCGWYVGGDRAVRCGLHFGHEGPHRPAKPDSGEATGWACGCGAPISKFQPHCPRWPGCMQKPDSGKREVQCDAATVRRCIKPLGHYGPHDHRLDPERSEAVIPQALAQRILAALDYFAVEGWVAARECAAQELARINAGVVGESPGASALRDVKALEKYEVDSFAKLARLTNVDVAPPLDAQTILDAMNRAWVRIIRARMQDDAIEATRLAFSPQECGRLLLAEHAALRWERVARRWATKHPSPWKKLDPVDMDAFTQRMVDAFLRWFYGLEPKP